MAKAFGLVLMLIAMYIGMTMYTGGLDRLHSASSQPAAGEADSPPATARVPVTEAVRQRVTASFEEAARRRDF